MQREIDGVTACKPDEALYRRTYAKGEIAGQEEVADKTDQIACYVCCICRGDTEQQQIDKVMNGRRQSAIEYKAHKLPPLSVLTQSFAYDIPHIHTPKLHRAKVTKKSR